MRAEAGGFERCGRVWAGDDMVPGDAQLLLNEGSSCGCGQLKSEARRERRRLKCSAELSRGPRFGAVLVRPKTGAE